MSGGLMLDRVIPDRPSAQVVSGDKTMIGVVNRWRHPEPPWIIVAGVVLVLALMDRFSLTGTRFANQILGWSTILCGIIGSLYCWMASYRGPLHARPAASAAVMIRIFLSWLIGPFAVIGAALAAHDIDGGTLLFYPPLLGVPLALFVLPCLLIRRRWRLEKARPRLNPDDADRLASAHIPL